MFVEKDFCRFIWEERKVSRMGGYTLYFEYKDHPIDVYPVKKDIIRDYDSLNIDFSKLDYSKSYQELGLELYKEYMASSSNG